MKQSWSKVVLMFFAYLLSVKPLSVNGYTTSLPYNYMSFTRNLFGGDFPGAPPVVTNPEYPAQVVMGLRDVNPRNIGNMPMTGLPGGVNLLSQGLINAGLNLGGAVNSILGAVTSAVGAFFSGGLSDGSITDNTMNYNTMSPVLPDWLVSPLKNLYYQNKNATNSAPKAAPNPVQATPTSTDSGAPATT